MTEGIHNIGHRYDTGTRGKYHKIRQILEKINEAEVGIDGSFDHY